MFLLISMLIKCVWNLQATHISCMTSTKLSCKGYFSLSFLSFPCPPRQHKAQQCCLFLLLSLASWTRNVLASFMFISCASGWSLKAWSTREKSQNWPTVDSSSQVDVVMTSIVRVWRHPWQKMWRSFRASLRLIRRSQLIVFGRICASRMLARSLQSTNLFCTKRGQFSILRCGIELQAVQ